MGIGGFSIWHLLIVLLIVVVIFGTKRLKDIGQDLGGAVKGFKKAMEDTDAAPGKPRQLDRPDAEFPESGAAKRESEHSGKG